MRTPPPLPPPIPFNGLAVELLKHGYRRCLVAEVSCPEHGAFRISDTTFLDATYPCPECEAPCEYTILCCEITKKDLPSVEFVHHPLTSLERQERRRSQENRRRRLAAGLKIVSRKKRTLY